MRPFWAADVAAPMRKEWLEKFLADMPADSFEMCFFFFFWNQVRLAGFPAWFNNKGSRGGSSLENSETEILANGLVRLERRMKIKNVNEVTFLDLVCLTLFDQKGDGFAIEDS